ncbi:hypothetical protein DFH09DRAFT_294806 [Mycena vulgaris]|nr:hypothetical protein DFH09DRAFT_294806 [Mycena vulgaris]
MEVVTIVQDQLVAHGDKAAVNFKNDCEKLASVLQDILKAVKQLQKGPSGFWRPVKTVFQLSGNTDQIGKHQKKIQNLRSNLNLLATIETNFRVGQIQEALAVVLPKIPMDQVPKSTTDCPSPSRHFHGRTDVLKKMHQYFTKVSGAQQIFLLYGLGGSGKTQTALKFIQESSAQFSGIFLIDASTTETIAAGLKNIAMARSLGNDPDDALRWLQSKPSDWLLFFDNADDPKLDLNKFLPKCSHGNIVLTSRNHGLQVYAGGNHEVQDMEEVEAEELLLKSAELELTPANRKVAAEIVKVLCCLALAIIQAGAFIAVSEDLAGYLESYAKNRARLLSEKPTQSHDDYAWTVYTTWQISFDQLSEPAAGMLRLWSFLHHNKISETMFSNASKYKCGTSGPSEDELEKPFQFISHFLDPTGYWDSFRFRHITKEIRSYSLIYYDQGQKMFSMHPLVHDWCRDTVLNQESYQYCMSAILGMAINEIPNLSKQVDHIQLLPHVQALTHGDVEIKPDFRQQYGHVYWSAGAYKNAAQLFVIVVERRRMILGREHQDTLIAMDNLASTYYRLGQSQEAEELQVEVLEKRRKILGRDHPDTLIAMNTLANIYHKLDRSQEAEELQVQVLEKWRKIVGREHPGTLSAMNNLAKTYSKLGRLQGAEELQVEVLEKRRKILGREHPDTLDAMHNLAITYYRLGQLQGAKELQLEVLEKRRKILGREHQDTLITMGNLAQIYSKLGQSAKAEELQVEVLEKRGKTLGREHPDTLNAMHNLANTYFKLGRSQQAKELRVEVLEKRRKIPVNDLASKTH